MILGTFSGADYPLNAMPVRGMQEVTHAHQDRMHKMKQSYGSGAESVDATADFINQQLMKNSALKIFVAKCRTSPVNILDEEKREPGDHPIRETYENLLSAIDGRQRYRTRRWWFVEEARAGSSEAVAVLREDELKNCGPGHYGFRRKDTNCRNARSCWSEVGIDFLLPVRGLCGRLRLVQTRAAGCS